MPEDIRWIETDSGEAVALLAEILDNRAAGNTNTMHGNGDASTNAAKVRRVEPVGN